MGRKFFAICLFIILGCATLGAGIGAGYAIMQRRVPPVSEIVQNYPVGVSSVRINPVAVPINPQEPNIADIVPVVKDAVVSISVIAGQARPFGGQAPGSGSGFIFHEDEDFVFIATNSHVVENASIITVSLDDTEDVPAHIVGADPDSDLAVLAVYRAYMEEKSVPYTVASFGDSSVMRMGDTVLAIGNAMGGGQVVTKGIVSALDLTIEVADPNRRGMLTLNVMQTDAAVNRGNSGGPLLNQNGEVIGIVTAKQIGADIEGMGYAIPSNVAMNILSDLKETGTVRRPWIGIGHDEFSEFLRSLFNMPYSGVLVREVFPDSPAQAAGIMVNDLLIYFNDVRLYGWDEFFGVLADARPGDSVKLTVFREGEYVVLDLVLGSIR